GRVLTNVDVHVAVDRPFTREAPTPTPVEGVALLLEALVGEDLGRDGTVVAVVNVVRRTLDGLLVHLGGPNRLVHLLAVFLGDVAARHVDVLPAGQRQRTEDILVVRARGQQVLQRPRDLQGLGVPN